MRETTDVRVRKLAIIGAVREALQECGISHESCIIADDAATRAISDLFALEPAPKPAGGEWVIADGANSHCFDVQILRDGKCVAFANEPEASAIAAAMNIAPTPPAAAIAERDERVERKDEALRWYEDQARATAKHMKKSDAIPIEAILTALALDGGNRARAALQQEGE